MYLDVKDSFNAIADRYDAGRRLFIPCFDDFYRTAIEQIPFERDAEFQVHDIGAGTGLLSAFVRNMYPKARIILMDFAAQMLGKARERFAGDERVSFVVGDYLRDNIAASCDVIISALSIHHLPDESKRELYHKIHGALSPQGIFINADLVLGATPRCEANCYEQWVRQMKERGISDEEFAGWRERLKEDRYARLEDQLRWLREEGFTDVDCFYRYYNFAVFAARR